METKNSAKTNLKKGTSSINVEVQSANKSTAPKKVTEKESSKQSKVPSLSQGQKVDTAKEVAKETIVPGIETSDAWQEIEVNHQDPAYIEVQTQIEMELAKANEMSM